MSGHRPPHGAQRIGLAGQRAQLHRTDIRQRLPPGGMQVDPWRRPAVQLASARDQCLQGLVGVGAALGQHLLPGAVRCQQQHAAAWLGEHEEEIPCAIRAAQWL